MNFKYLLIVILLLILSFFLTFKLNIFQIKNVQVDLDHVECVSSQGLKEDLQISGKNLILLKGQDFEKKILNKYPCLKSISIVKHFPGTVLVKASGRIGFMRIDTYLPEKLIDLDPNEATSSSQSALIDWSLPNLIPKPWFVADQEGFIFVENSIFKTSEEIDLPILFVPNQDLKINQKVKISNFDKIVEIYQRLNFGSLKLKLVEESVLIPMEPKVIFSLRKDILRQITSLQLILQKSTMNESDMNTIDLRFDKPVVVYSPKKERK